MTEQKMCTMSYDTFSRTVAEKLQTNLGASKNVEIRKVLKNNGVELDGIMVMGSGYMISPTFYMEVFYEAFLNGTSIDEIIEHILPFYRCEYHNDFLSFEEIENFELIKPRIFMKLINTSQNKDLLETIPSIPFLDLSIAFYTSVKSGASEIGTMLVNNDCLSLWQKDTDEIFNIAYHNTAEKTQFHFADIRQLLIDIMDEADTDFSSAVSNEKMESSLREDMEDMEDMEDIPPVCDMYVLSNKKHFFGAVSMVYTDYMEKISKELDDDYYIIPSSVHEIIIVPKSQKMTKPELENILRSTNETQVPKGEVLSENVYTYDRKLRKIIC